jgi:hypothetical protein
MGMIAESASWILLAVAFSLAVGLLLGPLMAD